MRLEARNLVETLRRQITDERVLQAIGSVPRERFVGVENLARAYDNSALPIDCEQTISQPLVVARMLEVLELRGSELVLDVGTGSGYHAALLAALTEHVWTIERHSELSRQAQETVASLGIANISFFVGDGHDGLMEHAPYDAINVAAAIGERIPAALENQLAAHGRLVAPVGGTDQRLVLMRRSGERLESLRLEPVRFVPLVRDR